jgi:hypothetical protein
MTALNQVVAAGTLLGESGRSLSRIYRSGRGHGAR